jgi:hypothetical protein
VYDRDFAGFFAGHTSKPVLLPSDRLPKAHLIRLHTLLEHLIQARSKIASDKSVEVVPAIG